jgi:hypothetical protein
VGLNNAHEGYDYQDLIISYFILKEILTGNKDSIFSIDKKHTTENNVDRFDDLVIENSRYIHRKQIKYSNEVVSKKLTKDDLSADSQYKLAIYKLFETWKELRTPSSEFRLCLAWDEPTDENIVSVLEPIATANSSFSNFPTKLYKINLDNLWEENPTKFNRWDSLKKYVEDNQIDRNEFKQFCEELIIELELPKASLKFEVPSFLENILYQQAQKLGIEQYPNDDIDINRFLIILAKKVGEYRTRSAEISVENILKDLRIKTDFGHLAQKFEIDQTKNIKSNEKFESFKTQIVENKKTLLIGEPGSGKSWLLTNFIEYLDAISQNVIRHYCFTSTEDEFIEKRITSDVFFGNLIADIIKHFPSLLEVKEKLFVSDLDELNILLTHIDEELIIIIDGLDHIDRVLKNSSALAQEKTKIIEFITQIELPDNIYIILGSQPISEIRKLIDECQYIEYLIPQWTQDDAICLMDKYSLEDRLLDTTKLLSEYILEKSEGNPLYLTYIIKTLLYQDISVEVINNLPRYDYNLQAYYEYLTSQIDNNLTAEMLSCLEFSVTKEELGELIPRSHHLEKNLKVLSPVIVENLSRGGIRLYHDSFRRFNIEKLEAEANINETYQDIIEWLEAQGFYNNAKSYRYLLKYYIKVQEYLKVKEYASNDFLTQSLYNGYSEATIKINYDNFLFVARETLDWSLFIYISELNRTIYSTLAEEYHSAFLEKFELYFEAIGLIYGFDRANEILFFDGKANFSNEITAKAFYILHKNGYIPNWDLIRKYFKNEIPLKDYHYYLSSLIGSDIDLYHEFEEIISDDYVDFFKIFIIEIYKQCGFEKILEFYNKVEKEKRIRVAVRINKALNETTCEQRIFLRKNKKSPVLKELSLDFIDGHIKEEDLAKFYFLVQLYSEYSLEQLKTFEKTIPSKNLFFNFLKFFIRTFIIEADIARCETYKCLEDKIVANFEFLASDIEAYKGKPRFIDITYNNKDIINKAIEQGLKYIKTQGAWDKVIHFLNEIPYNTIAIIEKQYVNDENINFIIETYEQFDKIEGQNYYEHEENAFRKAIYYAKIGKQDIAKQELKKALYFITGYTSHKDRTLSEIIEPLVSLNNANHEVAKEYAKKLKYLTDAVMKHTDDGKDTRWLTIEWFEEFLKIDYRLSSMYLLHQLLNNTYFWKLDYMFVDYIQSSQSVDPIILNFLYRLSPTNSKNEYIESFADNIYLISKTDEKLARQSLINILARDLNDSHDTLTKKTIQKLKFLKNLLNVKKDIKQKKEDKDTTLKSWNESLVSQINRKFAIDNLIFSNKTIDEINQYFETKDKLTDNDLNNLYFYLKEGMKDSLYKDILLPLIQKRASREEDYYDKVKHLISYSNISDNTKILLYVNIFMYAKDDWFSQFSNKEALKDAMKINQEETLSILSKALFKMFSNLGYGSKSTANLIIALEYVGISRTDIVSMYQVAFDFLQNRLPDENDFKWEVVEDARIEKLSDDELAIVILLSKMKNVDSPVQQEIIFTINYFLHYNDNLMLKPLIWFFQNIQFFPHLSIASVIEVLILNVEKKKEFLELLLNDIILSIKSIENMYIQNSITILLNKLKNV